MEASEEVAAIVYSGGKFFKPRAGGVWAECEVDLVKSCIQRVAGAMRDTLPEAECSYLVKGNNASTLIPRLKEAALNEEFEAGLDKLPREQVAFANGILHAGDGLRDVTRGDMVTRKSMLRYSFADVDQAARAQVERLYEQILPDAAERALFQEVVGAAFFKDHGKRFLVLTDERKGWNGKTFLMRFVENTFDVMAAGCQKSFILQQTANDQNAHGGNTIPYCGKRLAFFDELASTMRIDMSKLKELTSGRCKVTARVIRESQMVEFVWEALIVLACNQNCFPKIDASDAAWLSRMVVIPFKAKFCGSEEDYRRCEGEPYTYMANAQLTELLEEERFLVAHVHVLRDAYARYLQRGRVVHETPDCQRFKRSIALVSDPALDEIREWMEGAIDFQPPRPVDVGPRTVNYCFLSLKELRKRCVDDNPRLASRLTS